MLLKWPRLLWLLLWIVLVFGGVAVIVMDWDLRLGRTEELWPVSLVSLFAGTVGFLAFLVAPLFCLIGAVVQRNARLGRIKA